MTEGGVSTPAAGVARGGWGSPDGAVVACGVGSAGSLGPAGVAATGDEADVVPVRAALGFGPTRPNKPDPPPLITTALPTSATIAIRMIAGWFRGAAPCGL